ncbi:ABC transporter permease [Fusibacter sp. 3D3]|uniref:ABC transporter permease n=1 Tax=Fusibacter sp. 3D3 TaxID=1048380 RepID=UPI0008537148|nr:ABC transporter permease [Fusibacter sp. 3D3]GAU79478.1 dipeptide transport system permease protein DppC [Fusibacter sp. 3D3]
MQKKKSLNFYIGAFIVGALFLLMVTSYFYMPYSVTEMNLAEKLQPPSVQHLMGTDHFGRDIFSRLMQGSQTAFYVGLISVGIGLCIGVIIGSIAGYVGGRVDDVLMRFMDALMAFPGILFALLFVAVFGVGIFNTMVALGILAIPNFARITRSGFLQVKNFTYVDMARTIGVPSIRIMFVHILPNIMSALVVASSIGLASAILSEAGLSYLGLGVQPPNPSWGRMLSESQKYLIKAPYYALAPGVMITLAVLGFNLLGDGIRDLRDPRK